MHYMQSAFCNIYSQIHHNSMYPVKEFPMAIFGEHLEKKGISVLSKMFLTSAWSSHAVFDSCKVHYATSYSLIILKVSWMFCKLELIWN